LGNIDVGFIVIWFVALLFSLSFHEAAHAWTSEKFGDDTGRLQGRITMNPIAHIDPFGTVLFPLVSAITSIPLLGWAKPVQTNPNLWRNKTTANISVSAAGPISNFILATISFAVLAVFISTKVFIFNDSFDGNIYKVFAAAPNQSQFIEPIGRWLNIMLVLNLSLGFFNLLPIPPLDGSHVLESLLPLPMAEAYAQIRPYGIFLLFALMYLGVLTFITTPIIYVLKILLTFTQ
jgi:Zn-dependent protease